MRTNAKFFTRYTLMTVFKKDATGNSVFVPLNKNGVYLLSTGEELFKFRF